MEDLNKQQVILLAILVSIVTSIATGITTVSLVAQNPGQTVTQTINRVVERTVERVVEAEPAEPEIVIVEAEPEKEVVTVVVNENDKIIDAIAANSSSLVRIHEDWRDQSYVALGLIISSDGSMYVPAQFYSSRRDYYGKFSSGEFPLKLIYTDPAQRFVLLKPEEAETVAFNAIELGNTNTLSIGEQVVSLGGESSLVVTQGIINSLNTRTGIVNSETEGEIETPSVTLVNTSVDDSKVITGSTLIISSGEVIGIRTGREGSQGSFSSVSSIRDALLNLPVQEAEIPDDLAQEEVLEKDIETDVS